MSRDRASADKYQYTVLWSEEDQSYLARVAEFPSLSSLDQSPEAALAGMRDLVADILEDLSKSGEEIPVPFSLRTYSGNIKVRVSPQKHRELAARAAELGVSLNRYLNEQLSVR